MDWLIDLLPVVGIGIMIIVIMRVFASMPDEQDKKRKEVGFLNPMFILIGVVVGLMMLAIMGGMATITQSGYPQFGGVTISREGSLFPSFSYVIIAIGVFSAIYLFRRDLFKKRSVRIG